MFWVLEKTRRQNQSVRLLLTTWKDFKRFVELQEELEKWNCTTHFLRKHEPETCGIESLRYGAIEGQ